MNPNIQFPLTINGKVYNSIDEVPEEFKNLISLEKLQNIENNITTKKEWKIKGVTYTNLNDIPEEFKKFFGDANNNGIPDMFEFTENDSDEVSNLEKVLSSELSETKTSYSNQVSKPAKLKETPLEEFYNQNDQNKNNNEQSKKTIYTVIAFLILIIVGLAAYIMMSGKF
jgi:hypothetical protein